MRSPFFFKNPNCLLFGLVSSAAITVLSGISAIALLGRCIIENDYPNSHLIWVGAASLLAVMAGFVSKYFLQRALEEPKPHEQCVIDSAGVNSANV